MVSLEAVVTSNQGMVVTHDREGKPFTLLTARDYAHLAGQQTKDHVTWQVHVLVADAGQEASSAKLWTYHEGYQHGHAAWRNDNPPLSLDAIRSRGTNYWRGYAFGYGEGTVIAPKG